MSRDVAPDQGLYGPDGATRRLSRERVMLLGGPRALLLQIAHPLVAAGVAQHSSFGSDPLLRLRRTLDATLAVVFGTTAEAGAAVARINAVHRAVAGDLPETSGRYPAGTPYRATDPELLLWVHATLVDTTLEVYSRFVAPLSRAERNAVYEESKLAATLLGVPEEVVPIDLDAFESYMDGMIASDAIAVASFQRELADQILYPRLRFVPRLVHRPTVALTTALLPPKVRDAFGLELTPMRRLAVEWSQRLLRVILPVLPGRLRVMPQARRAQRRMREGGRYE